MKLEVQPSGWLSGLTIEMARGGFKYEGMQVDIQDDS